MTRRWNPEVEGAEQEMFDSLVTRNKISFEHQTPLMINCTTVRPAGLNLLFAPKLPTQFGFGDYCDCFIITLNVQGQM